MTFFRHNKNGNTLKNKKFFRFGKNRNQNHKVKSLNNQEYLFRVAFESSLNGIAVIDYEGNIMECNPAGLEIFGFDATSKDLHINIFDLMTDDTRSDVSNLLDYYEKYPILKNEIFEMKHKDGRVLQIEVSSTHVPGPERSEGYFVTTFRDITKNLEQERKLKEALKKAEESDHLKMAFLTNMSHEIRTPMNAIVGFSDMLSNPELSQAEKKEYIRYIKESSETLLHLINDILDLSKIESGQVNIYKEPFSLNEFILDFQPYIKEIQNKYRKDYLKIKFITPGNQDIILNSDKMRIRQILSNLIGNAIKFTEEGFVEVGYSVDNDIISFYVKDTGPGIPKEEVGTIFERFRQVENTLTRKYGGAGLGLAITKNLVKHLGGTISVNSVVGKGTTFNFTIPGIENTFEISGKKRNLKTGKYPDWHDKTVLIAEDESSNYDFLETVLKKTGINILLAKNGREAIQLCSQYKPDILLLDIRMPEIDGFSSLKEIRKIIPGIPAIVQTAYAMADERQKCLDAGFDVYLAKPIKPSILLNKMNEYLS
ncbi:MAG TPA: response regulator [Bacteroidetes bacterium]|nr:response regulator [Bacteroidota bacterium]